jgi:hypothetical protein
LRRYFVAVERVTGIDVGIKINTNKVLVEGIDNPLVGVRIFKHQFASIA